MKHTPGPWIIEERTQKPYPNAAEENFLFINGDDASDVCRMMRIGGDTVIANARLIAAAPDLYEIGTKVYTAMASGKITDELLDELNEVLQKAEGRK